MLEKLKGFAGRYRWPLLLTALGGLALFVVSFFYRPKPVVVEESSEPDEVIDGRAELDSDIEHIQQERDQRVRALVEDVEELSVSTDELAADWARVALKQAEAQFKEVTAVGH